MIEPSGFLISETLVSQAIPLYGPELLSVNRRVIFTHAPPYIMLYFDCIHYIAALCNLYSGRIGKFSCAFRLCTQLRFFV